jgi:hypothetical protein
MLRNQAGSVAERPVTFGPAASLVGIESTSTTAGALAGRPACLLLNAGVIHRVGPNRLHVNVARRLAAAGYPTLRFDLSGRGDSESRTDGMTFQESSVAEVRQAMDHLAQTLGAERFVVIGICSGGLNAAHVAIVDSRISGAVMIDVPAYPTLGYYLRYYGRRLGSVESWRNTLAARNPLGRRLRKRLAPMTARNMEDDFGGALLDVRMPSKVETRQTLEELVGRGTRLYFIFSGTWGSYNYRDQFRDAFPSLMSGGQVTVDYIPDADHTFTQLINQERLVGRIARWVAGEWPPRAEASAAAPRHATTAPVAYSARRCALDEAEADLIRASNDNLPPGTDRLQRFNWYYRGNPAGAGEVFLLRAESPAGGHVVGCTGLGPRVFRHHGLALRAALASDFAVDREHRITLPAVRLQEAAAEHARASFDLAYGFPNASALGVFVRVGFVQLGRMSRFVKILRHEPYLRQRSPVAGFARAGAWALDAGETMREGRRAGAVPANYVYRWLRDFDQRFDALDESFAARIPIAGERTAKWLSWRFSDAAGAASSIAALIDSGTDELRAYAIVAPKEPGIARIADIVARTEDDFSWLLARLIPDLRFQGFTSATFSFLGPAWVGRRLRRSGFRLRDADRAVVLAVQGQDSANFSRSENWYLTAADTDT